MKSETNRIRILHALNFDTFSLFLTGLGLMVWFDQLHMKNFYDDESLESALDGFVHACMSIES